MKELPKELTPELLSLVYPDWKDRLYEWMEIEDNELNTYYDCGRYDEQGRPTGLGMTINIDTLTRLMNEWCFKQGYSISTTPHGIEVYDTYEVPFKHGYHRVKFRRTADVHSFSLTLEHYVLATHWVAREIGLLKGN